MTLGDVRPSSANFRRSQRKRQRDRHNAHLNAVAGTIFVCTRNMDNAAKLQKQSSQDQGVILITGADGHIGRRLCPMLRGASWSIAAVDLSNDPKQNIDACDLRSESQVSSLFERYKISAVIHLAGILPTAFQSDPLTGAEVNLTGSLRLIRHSIRAGVNRFVFASSMSVYGSNTSNRALNERDLSSPDDVYGAAKRAVEIIGESLSTAESIEFIALRIARVIGPGIRKTSSPWRSQIFETASDPGPVHLPFAPDALLSLVHVVDVARMISLLVEAERVNHCVYNTPVEVWEARRLKELIESMRRIPVQLDETRGSNGGPICDGSRFAQEFGFHPLRLRDHLLAVGTHD